MRSHLLLWMRLLRMVPGSARNWIEVNSVNNPTLTKNENKECSNSTLNKRNRPLTLGARGLPNPCHGWGWASPRMLMNGIRASSRSTLPARARARFRAQPAMPSTRQATSWDNTLPRGGWPQPGRRDCGSYCCNGGRSALDLKCVR